MFLIGLFIIAAGLGCLETAANPFVTVLGPEKTGHFRINLAQTFNSFGAIIAVVFGQSLILSNVPHQTQEVLDKLSTADLNSYHHSLVKAVQLPYLIIVAGLVACGILTLALQNCTKTFWITAKRKVSILLSTFGTLIFMISLQPYAAMFTFFFLIVKTLMLIKWE